MKQTQPYHFLVLVADTHVMKCIQGATSLSTTIKGSQSVGLLPTPHRAQRRHPTQDRLQVEVSDCRGAYREGMHGDTYLGDL